MASFFRRWWSQHRQAFRRSAFFIRIKQKKPSVYQRKWLDFLPRESSISDRRRFSSLLLQFVDMTAAVPLPLGDFYFYNKMAARACISLMGNYFRLFSHRWAANWGEKVSFLIEDFSIL